LLVTMVDIERYRTQLLQARTELLDLEEARRESAATVELDQSRTGRLSRMDALQQQAMAQSGRQRAQVALHRIEAALRRCEDGSYGLCVDCEEAIDPRRLELDPATPLCIACARARDT
jgi:DnaK suppressor protein